MKGFGFFLGGLLLQGADFRPALWIMTGLPVLALAFGGQMPGHLGRTHDLVDVAPGLLVGAEGGATNAFGVKIGLVHTATSRI